MKVDPGLAPLGRACLGFLGGGAAFAVELDATGAFDTGTMGREDQPAGRVGTLDSRSSIDAVAAYE